jgi:hypothetical protein
MYSRIRLLLCAFAVFAAQVLLLPASVANSAPDDPLPPGSLTLSLTDLGSNQNLLFYGQIGTTVLTVPVPDGMAPATLNVVAQLPVNVRSGTVTVTQDDRVLAQVDVPPVSGPLVIPLAGARVVDNAVSVLIRDYLLPLDGYCLDPTNPLRLTDATVTYTGVERPPATVADFLPPVLRKLVIYVGDKPSLAEAGAVVQLATAIAAHYGKQNPAIEVSPLAPAPGPLGNTTPFERHIVIAQGADAGISLYGADQGMPALLISGSPNELINQTRLLTSGLVQYALTSKAVVGPLKSTPQLRGNDTTIRKLGQPGVNATALNPQVGIALDQTRLGHSAHDLRVHLQGSYTPLPTSIGGQLVATVAGETVDRWPADPSGVVDRWVTVPDRILQRYTTLDVQVNISGNTGRCGEFQPITLTIDGESAVQSVPAKPPVPVGFQSMPQALMPRVQIGIGDGVFGDTVRAVQIMTGLQRLSSLPIDTEVMPLQQAIDSPNPAVLISPEGWNQDPVRLPLWAPGAVPTTVNALDDDGNPTTLTLLPGLRFGSLQAVFDGHRSVLVATSNGAPEQLDDLLRWLGSDERRWSDIDGVALLSVPGRDPVTVSAPETTANAPEKVTDESTAKWWWIGGVFLAVVALVTVWLVWRDRRRAARDG